MNNSSLVHFFINNPKAERLLSRLTINAYQNNLEQLLTYVQSPLRSVDHFQVEKYLTFLRSHHESLQTIKRKTSTCRSFYNFLLKNRFVKINPSHYLHWIIPRRNLSYHAQKRLYSNAQLILRIQKGSGILKFRNQVLWDLLYNMRLKITKCTKLLLNKINFLKHDLVIKSSTKEQNLFIK